MTIRFLLLFFTVPLASGCAFLRLNGCSKLASCGDLGAYACADDLICADAEGNTLRAEPVSSSRNPCHICVESSN